MQGVQRNKTFNFSYTSTLDGEKYEGTFTIKKLSIADQARVGVVKTQLNGGYHYDEDHPGTGIDLNTDSLHFMIAHLEASCIQFPIWFKPREIIEYGLLEAVFRHVNDFEMSFFRREGQKVQGHDAGGDADSNRQSPQPESGGQPAQVVDEKVRAALEA